uniref:ATP synthase subunit epsilon, mitochondrial n=1 Tax=Steinernema glaseri TaxID=37863 RepID=A0A1I7YED7_9BILA
MTESRNDSPCSSCPTNMFWRAAGLNYVRYSKIAAEVTRKCTQASKAPKKGEATLKVTAWEAGKPKKIE